MSENENKNGDKWIRRVAWIMPIAVTFIIAVMAVGQDRAQVRANAADVQDLKNRTRALEQAYSASQEHLRHIDQTTEEIKQLLKDHNKESNAR